MVKKKKTVHDLTQLAVTKYKDLMIFFGGSGLQREDLIICLLIFHIISSFNLKFQVLKQNK